MNAKRAATLAVLTGVLALGAAAETVIKAGTVIKVVLDTPVNSAKNHPGDSFTLHCAADDCGGFPNGTTFQGTLTAVHPKTEQKPGVVEVSISRADLPSGEQVKIDALPATQKGKVRERVRGSTGKKDLKKKTRIGGFVGNLIIGPAATIGGAVASKTLPAKPKELDAKPGDTGYLRLMAPVTLK
jgi:hypothetical protein